MVLGEARKPFTELRRGVAEYCVLATQLRSIRGGIRRDVAASITLRGDAQ